MRKIKNSLFVWLLLVVSIASSCSSDPEIIQKDNKLPMTIANDFKERFNGFSIDKVYHGTDFYRHTAQKETIVYCKDADENSCFVAYDDGAWNRTIRVLPDVASLPLSVKKRLTGDYAEAIQNGFDKMTEVAMSGIEGMFYFFSYLQDTPLAKNCVHNLILASDGRVLKQTTYPLNAFESIRPLPAQISWIAKKYPGAEILGYVNDLGDDEYLIVHEGILKSVYFHIYLDGSEVVWKKTEYVQPKEINIPQKVLDVLHTNYAGFAYTKVIVTEAADGLTYSFVEEHEVDSPVCNIKVN